MAAPVQIVWGNNGTSAAATVNAAFPATNGAGNAIIVYAITNRASGDNLTIGDTGGNTYTVANTLNEANTPGTLRGWVAVNIAGAASNTVTVTDNTANAVMGIVIAEIAGTVTTAGDDKDKVLSQVAPGTAVGNVNTGSTGAVTGTSIFGFGLSCWITGGSTGVNTITAFNFGSAPVTATSTNGTNITVTGWGNGSGSGIGPARVQWRGDMFLTTYNSKMTDATNGGTGGAVFDSIAVYLDQLETLIGQATL